MSLLAPAILVFEKRPCWEAELKRRFTGARVLVRPCRSGSDLLELSQRMPGSVAVIDLAAGAAASLKFLEQISVRRLDVRPVVVASPDARDLEWPFRELGARAYLTESTGGEVLAGLCRRLLPET